MIYALFISIILIIIACLYYPYLKINGEYKTIKVKNIITKKDHVLRVSIPLVLTIVALIVLLILDLTLSDLFIDPVAFEIFGLEVRWYALWILLGVVVAVILGVKEGKRIGIYSDFIYTGILITLPLAIIGARIWYVLGDLEDFAGKDFLYIINPASGGLAIQGGVMAGVIFGIFYFKKRYKEVPLSYHFDTIVPSVLIGQILGRWGNFMNQEVYGACVEQNKLWFIPSFILENVSTACPYGEVSQPLFLYESFLNLIGFILIAIVLRNYWKKNRKPGDLFACYFIWYGLV